MNFSNFFQNNFIAGVRIHHQNPSKKWLISNYVSEFSKIMEEKILLKRTLSFASAYLQMQKKVIQTGNQDFIGRPKVA